MLRVSAGLHDHQRVHDYIHEAASDRVEQDKRHEGLDALDFNGRRDNQDQSLQQSKDDYPGFFARATYRYGVCHNAVNKLEAPWCPDQGYVELSLCRCQLIIVLK